MKEDHPKFDLNLEDFFSRWQRARISAIQKSFPIQEEISEELSKKMLSESDLLEQYFSQDFKDFLEKEQSKNILLKNIFDNSRLLAKSLSKHLGLTFEIQDFRKILEKSQIPCVQGRWETRKTSEVLSRKGCDFCPQAEANICDYWREALDGLVMGLGEKERFVRHACSRRGDFGCVDVFYYDSEARSETSLAWGPLPDHMASSLMEVCQDFEKKMKIPILLKGMNEGILYFEFKASTDQLCGGGKVYTMTFQRKIQARYPGVKVQEVTPRSVLGVEA